MTPIFEPLLVRRSERSSTLAASRAVVAPPRTARAKSAQRVRAQALERALVGLERMAGEEEADRVEFALQPLGRRPRRSRCTLQRRGLGLAEQRALAGRLLLGAAVGDRQHRLDRGEGDGALGLELVERAGGGEAFQRLLVDARADRPRARNRRARRRAARRAPSTMRLRLRLADALDRAQAHRRSSARRRRRAHVEIDVRRR